jgi:phosphonate dehydrogenase
MARIVLTHWVFPSTIEMLQPHGDVIANDTRECLPREELFERLRGADAAMVFMPDRVDAEFVAHGPDLKIIAGALKGFDNIDLFACAANGVWVSNVPAALTAPTADLAVGLLLALTRHIVAGDARVRASGYDGWRPVLYGAGVDGKTIGIVGFGAVGQAVARRLRGFDAALLYWDPHRFDAVREADLGARYADLETLIAHCDHIGLAAPLVPGSEHLFDHERIERVKRGAYMVNIGRGSVVDENAVAAALKTGRLGGYAADVFEMEDLSRSDRPHAIPPALLAQADRTVFTPHLGSAVTDVRREIERQAALNILDVLQGRRPRNALNSPGAKIAETH